MYNGLASVHVNNKVECENTNWFAHPQLPAVVFSSDTAAMSVLEL